MKYVLLVVILVFLSCKKEEASGKTGSSKGDNSKEVTVTKPAEVKSEAPEAKTPEPKKVDLPKPKLSLLEAVKAGNLEEVKSNLHHNPKPLKDNETEYKEHPVFVAILEGQPKILKELLTVYSANCSSIRRGVPLVLAAIKKNLECVKILVDCKAELDAFDPSEMTAIYMASAKGYLEIVEYLCEKGADVNKVNKFSYRHRETALGIALQNERWKVVNYLKKKGAKQYKDLK